jgi:hypothetical protein
MEELEDQSRVEFVESKHVIWMRGSKWRLAFEADQFEGTSEDRDKRQVSYPSLILCPLHSTGASSCSLEIAFIPHTENNAERGNSILATRVIPHIY